MQLSLALPLTSSAISMNNRGMSTETDAAEKQKEAAKKLRNKALRLLTTREHSREELLKKLERSRTNAARRAPKTSNSAEHASSPANKDDIERIVAQLTAEGWQSDDRYADAMVRRLTGQASRRFIAGKLAQAGINKDDAETALVQLVQDDIEAAAALWKRRFGETPNDDKERQKQIRYLLVRGFGLGEAFKIVPPPKKITPSDMKSSPVPTQEQPATSKIAPRRSRQSIDVDPAANDAAAAPVRVNEEAAAFVDSIRASSLWIKSDGKKKSGSKSSFGQRKKSFGNRAPND
jgi:regulatory protein